MTKIEQIKSEIESRINFHKSLASAEHVYQNDYAVRELKDLLSFIESLEEEHPIDGLDEAADCYKDTIKPEDVEDSENFVFYETYTEEQIEDAFKAGAEWMAEQGIVKESTIGMSTKKIIITISEQTIDDLGLDAGGKVIFQIRKKQ